MKVIAIAGGSGAGKSAVSYELVDGDLERFEVINLDDYQKVGDSANLDVVEGMKNWDHPNGVDWHKLHQDLDALRAGNDVDLDVWAHRSNLNFAQHRQRIPRTIVPHPVMVVEGYLALHGAMRRAYDRSYYLDLDEEARLERRRQARHGNDSLSGNPRYNELVLMPMHRLFIEPTKTEASVVIDVREKSIADIVRFVLDDLVVLG